MLPDFLIIGAQKSGSSWLRSRLAQHPELFVAPDEIHFFDKKYNFAKGVSWYESFFDAASSEQVIGEKTPDYLWTNSEGAEGHDPDVHRNVHAVLPEAKLIAVLRNPVDRAISAVKHIIRSGRISPLHSLDELLLGQKRHLVKKHGVLDYGRYYQHLSAYREYFSGDQIKVLIFEEDVVRNPEHGLREACAFVGVDPGFSFQKPSEKVNAHEVSHAELVFKYYVPGGGVMGPLIRRLFPQELASPSQTTIHRLYEMYSEGNEKLFDLIEREVPSWQEPAYNES